MDYELKADHAGQTSPHERIAFLERQLADCKQDRAAARDADRRFHLLANSVEDYAFITYDLDHRVTGWNRGAQRILGYDEPSILGESGSLFFTPEDVKKRDDQRELALARAEGRAENERWHVRQDGTRFWGSGVMTPLFDEAGHVQGYAKVMRDLTLHREAEQQLRESEERFQIVCGECFRLCLDSCR